MSLQRCVPKLLLEDQFFPRISVYDYYAFMQRNSLAIEVFLVRQVEAAAELPYL